MARFSVVGGFVGVEEWLARFLVVEVSAVELFEEFVAHTAVDSNTVVHMAADCTHTTIPQLAPWADSWTRHQ